MSEDEEFKMFFKSMSDDEQITWALNFREKLNGFLASSGMDNQLLLQFDEKIERFKKAVDDEKHVTEQLEALKAKAEKSLDALEKSIFETHEPQHGKPMSIPIETLPTAYDSH